MKIGIITQPLRTNYGGILQAFALQKFLKKQGYEAITVDYALKTRSLLFYLLSIVKRAIFYFLLKKKNNYPIITPYISRKEKESISQNTRKFVETYINLTSPIKDEIKTSAILKYNFDAMLVGSDQVWRPQYNKNLENNFLDFISDDNIKKVAYAASFGVNNWEFTTKQTEKCSELLAKFHGVSTREYSGIDLCEKYLGVKSKCMVDPTLLLSVDEYIKLIKAKDFKDNKLHQIFTYILDINSDKRKVVDNVSNKLNIPANFELSDKINSQNDCFPAIEEWLNNFYCSDFIVTDSFHGTVFSIIFNKPFIVIANEERGVERFISLLSKFNLEDRLLKGNENINPEMLNNNINWERINGIIESERELSKEFINCSLS